MVDIRVEYRRPRLVWAPKRFPNAWEHKGVAWLDQMVSVDWFRLPSQSMSLLLYTIQHAPSLHAECVAASF